MRFPRLLFALALLLSGRAIAAEALTIGLGEGSRGPHVLSRDGTRCTGLANDLALDVAKRLGREVRCIALPRARLVDALRAGEIDAIPVSSPDWIEDPRGLRFSATVVVETQRLVVHPGRGTALRSLDDLDGLRIGGHLGYLYPADFNARVAEGRVQREDVATPEQNYLKLSTGRIDGFILSDLVFAWDRRRSPQSAGLFELSQLAVASSPIRWALRDDDLGHRVATALEAMAREGRTQAIAARYR